MWIYYYCIHGGGHQATTSGYKSVHNNADREDIKESLFRHELRDCRNSSLRFWKVDKIPIEIVKDKIEDSLSVIKYHKKRLKTLKAENCFIPQETDGEDATIQKNLRSKVFYDLMLRLHRAGFMYGYKDVYHWSIGKKHPIEPARGKILEIIRRTNSYND